MSRDPNPVQTVALGIPSTTQDITADDSDKTFTVPVSEEWTILSIMIEFTSTATAGNRQMRVRYTDDADARLAEINAGAVQAASLSRFYTFAPGVVDQAAFVGTALSTALPQMILSAGQKIRVLDSAAIDAAADDMTVRIQYLKRVV